MPSSNFNSRLFMMKKVRFLTHMPLIAGFGGLERQAQGYLESLSSKYDVDFLKRNEIDFDILHIVGHRLPLGQYFFSNLKAKWVKIVFSPVFYIRPKNLLDFRRPSVLKILVKLPYTQFKAWKILRDNADLILPNSVAEKKQLLSIFGRPAGKIEVIYNWVPGVDLSIADESILEKRSVQPYKYFVSISHIEPRKNTLNLIKAFLEFSREKPGYKLLLVGRMRGGFWGFFGKVQEFIKKHPDQIAHIDGLEHGSKEFVSILRFAKAHLLPSFLETPGLSSLEAASLGVPILIGNDEPVKEVFWKWWVNVNPYSVSNIALGIKKISELPHSQEMAKWVERYSQWIISKRLLELYEKEF